MIEPKNIFIFFATFVGVGFIIYLMLTQKDKAKEGKENELKSIRQEGATNRSSDPGFRSKKSCQRKGAGDSVGAMPGKALRVPPPMVEKIEAVAPGEGASRRAF